MTLYGKLIILEGNVGVGKTSTAKAIGEIRPDWVIISESYAKECPYLNQLYHCDDKEKCITLSTQTQSWILAKSLATLEEAITLIKQGKTVVLDRSVIGMMPFVVVGVDADMLSSGWASVVNDAIKETTGRLTDEGIEWWIILLNCSSQTSFDRVKARPEYIPSPRRDFEDLINLNLRKIQKLNSYYHRLIPVVGPLNFASISTERFCINEVADFVIHYAN